MHILLIVLFSFTLLLAGEPQRPVILPNRWEENWSLLANPEVPRKWLDNLKYIPLSSNPQTYLSFGADFRTRYEYLNAINFGVAPDQNPQSYAILRMEAHGEVRIANRVHLFVQLQNNIAPGKTIIEPPDKDRLDLEQAFLLWIQPIGNGVFRFRGGRQQMNFDVQRFVSNRDGPNTRESFDALWANYTVGDWEFLGFYSRPVKTLNRHCFDDYSSDAFTFSILRMEKKFPDICTLSSYIGHFKQDNTAFATASGNERRNLLDVRLSGNNGSYDWDIEAMGQIGHIAEQSIRAVALGSIFGYKFTQTKLTPRVGLQFDMATGDGSGSHFGTFNPLFPNGIFFNLANTTAYANLIHLKPSITLYPNSNLTASLAIAGQWRETTNDAVYVEPHTPIPNTAGRPGRYTGTYYQTDLLWNMSPNFQSALQIIYFDVAKVIHNAGGHNLTYIGAQLKIDW